MAYCNIVDFNLQQNLGSSMVSTALTEQMGERDFSGMHSQLALEALFEFYVANGVDICLEEIPQDRFAESLKLKEEAANRAKNRLNSPDLEKLKPNQGAVSGTQVKVTIPTKEIVQRAWELAKSATDLNALQELLKEFDGCNLKQTAKNLCFAFGNPKARVMFIEESPWSDEDSISKLFVEKSGKLFDRMIGAIGLDRNSVYFTHMVPWRPPGGRRPNKNEIEICMPFVARQIELVNPKFLVCLGEVAAQNITRESVTITKSRGQWKNYQIGSIQIPCLAMFRPKYLLEQQKHKDLAWQDMLELKDVLAKKS